MPAYVIARVQVSDMEQYRKYIAITPGVIAQYGGCFVARGGEVATLEGPEETHRIVILEFPLDGRGEGLVSLARVPGGAQAAVDMRDRYPDRGGRLRLRIALVVQVRVVHAVHTVHTVHQNG